MKSNRNIVYISHGGGPMPLLGDPAHFEMVNTLKHIAAEVGNPSAILVISAHWEARLATVTSGIAPRIIYDYGGFPEEAYKIQYPAPGEQTLAKGVVNVLRDNGIDAEQDEQRGFDHGLFVPLSIMYPEADIPCVQLSLVHGLDPELHIKIGKALQLLNWDNLLVIGSGFSFHNMRAFFNPNSPDVSKNNIAFDNWLHETLSDKALPEHARENQLAHWIAAPGARYCHPREEHLMPLHVCYGMATQPSDKAFKIEIMKIQASMFYWEIV
ncbi:DODA-type extradiol aromatic ring-opening family dioxygenase [Shewanella inventionis]|uniref:Dioxygenase n=1 Tax=Shewanella inventionis TaxID=1738770 RepID=A0ABQ1JYZ1_9GAMM|nr:class III extradiol ring-cleavage dioxygenase [Shewanella inventionis]MCL1160226.1 dioxygenase [Shewanella inventionis]GGB77988.1 dioxygenase [Shewanella inventionis]